MKRIFILFMLVSNYLFSQGEQRYPDGTSTDQNQNTFEWINYGTQDWSIENVEVTHYRDGTPIPQVTDITEWKNLTTGAWCYYNNDSTKGKLYNWFAVMGIHDNDENTPNKEFSPEGWRVPSDGDWRTLENYLISNGYNYDGTTTINKIGKSMSSTTGWEISYTEGHVGFQQSTNNLSGFNSFPIGERHNGLFRVENYSAFFWTSTPFDSDRSWGRSLNKNLDYLWNYNYYRTNTTGYSVRLVRESSTASIPEIKSNIYIYPNPTNNILNIDFNDYKSSELFSIDGKSVLKSTLKQIDLSKEVKGIYFLVIEDTTGKKSNGIRVIKE